MELTFIGHAGFRIDNLLIDPWVSQFEVEQPSDVIVVTHDHFDHHDGAFDFANEHDIPVVGTPETVEPAQNQAAMNIGGPQEVAGWDISLVQAFHTGNPTGAILQRDGTTIYHTGDTGLFGDMQLIGDVHAPDVMLVCIGGHFTMDVEQAAQAVAMVKPRVVIPMHYDTFDAIKADTKRFEELVKSRTDAQVRVLRPGESTDV